VEYDFTIPRSEFSSTDNYISTWKQSREYNEGVIKLKTTVSLSTDICQRTGERVTSAVILITVRNWKQDNTHTGSASIIFYDPITGTLLSESKLEERIFEEGHNYVKFEVSMGSHTSIEQCRSKRLKLQVKVRVQEQAFWQNITCVYNRPSKGALMPK
jgi:hypothetical protein